MNFTIVDLVLLGIFIVVTSFFLYRKRKNLKREGLLLLYKTNIGIKIINKIGDKYKRLLKVLGFVSVILGFVLMILVLFFIGKVVWIYLFQKEVVQMIKIPPIMPLIPYLPQIFKLNFLPPFYFIYWIVIIAVIAISHEFSHGIFASTKKVKIKKTGFGFFPFFLPVFLAAFVELDEKQMEKKKIFSQMTVLSAGTFANTICAIVFFGVLVLFFSLAFAPSGVVFDTYGYSGVNLSSISSVNGISIDNPSYENMIRIMDEEGFNEIKAENMNYILTKKDFEQQKDNSVLMLYNDAPAIRNNISSIIVKINNIEIKSREILGEELMKYSPEEKVIITTLEDDAFRDYEITLGASPENQNVAYLGIGFVNKQDSGVIGSIINVFSSFKKEGVYYAQKFEAAEFIYNLLWWLVLISFSVALVNMLPVGIFDGGRFFYLTMLAITKNPKISKKIFSIVTYLFLAILAVVMFFWAKSFFK